MGHLPDPWQCCVNTRLLNEPSLLLPWYRARATPRRLCPTSRSHLGPPGAWGPGHRDGSHGVCLWHPWVLTQGKGRGPGSAKLALHWRTSCVQHQGARSWPLDGHLLVRAQGICCPGEHPGWEGLGRPKSCTVPQWVEGEPVVCVCVGQLGHH